MRLEDLRPELRAQAEAQLAAGAKAVAPPGAPPPVPATAAEKRDERKLQGMCENYLQLHGFWPRTPEFIAKGRPPAGWYIHIVEARKNPILLDLLILHNPVEGERDGRYQEIELKTETGRLSEEQKMLVFLNGKLCRGIMEFINAMGLKVQDPPEHPTLESK